MGMAASQARLLSITSRMSDNELRAQIINNSKMRLATESSRVSEEYVNALNAATMMISNYDVDGNSQYQKLNFNALTSYSSHNNQYGLINANGQILVSENEAKLFKAANGDLNEYLKLHNLEYTSNYFKKETFDADIIRLEGFNENTQTTYNIGDYSIETLKTMYYGGIDENGIEHIGYDQALQSTAYVNFSDYFSQFEIAEENLLTQIIDQINSQILGKGGQIVDGGESFDTYYSYYHSNVSDKNMNQLINYGLHYLNTMLDKLNKEGKLPSHADDPEAPMTFYDTLKAAINNVKYSKDANGNVTDVRISSVDNITTNADGSINLGVQHKLSDNSIVSDFIAEEQEDGTYKLKVNYNSSEPDMYIDYKFLDENGNEMEPDADGYVIIKDLSDFKYNTYQTLYDDEGNVIKDENDNAVVQKTSYTYSYKGGDTADVTWTATLGEMQNYVSNLFLAYKTGVADSIDKSAFAKNTTDTATKNALNQYNESLKQLITLIFGENLSDKEYQSIKDNASNLNDIGWIITNYPNKTSKEFEMIKDIYVLDVMMDTYGEPAAGWVDTTNEKENANAKVQWFTNLFNRMQKGFKVLEAGLASSNEWIQFALESGLVTMEQVDKSNNWTGTIYSNVSTITEVTDDTAVARAEAEYKKAMNNIENKDKRFDMELKNIDTEHNSLQTEYDSVKNVISKNIERSFKIYS